jgi:hypothetical protein
MTGRVERLLKLFQLSTGGLYYAFLYYYGNLSDTVDVLYVVAILFRKD